MTVITSSLPAVADTAPLITMDRHVRDLWTRRLRDARDNPGFGALRWVHPVTRDVEFCPAGVLCEVFREDTGQGAWDGDEFVSGGHRDAATLPAPVAQWAGLVAPDGTVVVNPLLRGFDAAGIPRVLLLTEWNDSEGAGFAKIADLIDATL